MLERLRRAVHPPSRTSGPDAFPLRRAPELQKEHESIGRVIEQALPHGWAAKVRELEAADELLGADDGTQRRAASAAVQRTAW